MAIKLSFWLAVLLLVTQIHGDTWPQIQTDVGNYPDTNTAPLLADLNNGISPDTTGPNGWTAIHIAAGLNKPEMARILKQKGANLNIQDSSSYTPLHVAAGLDSVFVMRKLLPGANTEIKGPNDWTPLHVAAGTSHAESAGILMSNSANANAVESHGWTPLHTAVGNGHFVVVNMILGFPST
jgi:ankyrin repeat protein